MANQQHLELLGRGRDCWNEWRKTEPEVIPNLRCADLRAARLSRFNLSNALLAEADLRDADLRYTQFEHAKLSFSKYLYPFPDDRVGAKLSGADARWAGFHYADLSEVDFIGADLQEAVFTHANLSRADFSDANLSNATLLLADLFGTRMARARIQRADLEFARLNKCDLEDADLTGSWVYGISVWEVNLRNCKQSDLIVTKNPYPSRETSAVTVDSLELAQFIYLLLDNEKIRSVIDTITSKVVLILGRFTPERKAVLDTLREELRKRDYLPVLFDFDKPDSEDLTGTVSTLANMARFIIADLTDPSSIPHELATVIPNTVVPVQPVLLAGKSEYTMFVDFRRRYSWVLATHHYASPEHLVADLGERVIGPAEAKVRELRGLTSGSGAPTTFP